MSYYKAVLPVISAMFMATAADAQEVLKFHHDLSEDSAQHLGAQEFERLVEERTNSRIDVQIYANNALGNDVEVAQQMQFGAVHAAPIPTAKLSSFNPALQAVDLPFLFPNPEVAYKVLDSEVGKSILEGLEQAGFVGAMFWESGFKQLTCNHAVTKPEDLSGSKVRVMESPLLIAQYEALGAIAIPVAFSEVYTALQQGVVECQENPIVSIHKMKFYEVQDHLIISNHGYLATAFIFSKIWFDSLDAETREILLSSAQEAGVYQRKRSRELEGEYLADIIASGSSEVVELNPEQLAVFAKEMKQVHNKFADRIGPDLIQNLYKEIDSHK